MYYCHSCITHKFLSHSQVRVISLDAFSAQGYYNTGAVPMNPLLNTPYGFHIAFTSLCQEESIHPRLSQLAQDMHTHIKTKKRTWSTSTKQQQTLLMCVCVRARARGYFQVSKTDLGDIEH